MSTEPTVSVKLTLDDLYLYYLGKFNVVSTPGGVDRRCLECSKPEAAVHVPVKLDYRQRLIHATGTACSIDCMFKFLIHTKDVRFAHALTNVWIVLECIFRVKDFTW